MTAWTREHLRHAAAFVRQGRNPTAAVYDSVGTDFFLALDDGWLNLGLWEGDEGDPREAPAAVRRLVRTLAADLPTGGTVLDVGNGLGAQDELVAEVSEPRRLVALNLTRSQLVAGRQRLVRAGAHPVNADATRLPIRDGSVDGVLSVEAAFHFRPRARFFAEAFRVLGPGGVLSMSDVVTDRMPRGPREVAAGIAQLRLWGLRPAAAVTERELVAAVARAGFVDVAIRRVGDRVIGPALRFARRRLEDPPSGAPASMRLAARIMLGQMELLWRRRIVDYGLLRAVRRPG
jgi:SAM-dependent methyltransferase